MRALIAGIVLLFGFSVVRSDEPPSEDLIAELQNRLTLQRELHPNVKTGWIDTFLLAYIRESFRSFPSDARAATKCLEMVYRFDAWNDLSPISRDKSTLVLEISSQETIANDRETQFRNAALALFVSLNLEIEQFKIIRTFSPSAENKVQTRLMILQSEVPTGIVTDFIAIED